jgi:membrane protein DedA with SNARE-associated domain
MDLILTHGVPLVALMILLGELGLPTVVPTEVALVVVGSHSIRSLPALLAALGLIVVADLVGTTTLFLAVRARGVGLVRRLLGRPGADGEPVPARWQRRLGGRDAAVDFVGRLLPLARMPITIGVALLGTPLRRFLLGAAPSAVLWGGVPLVTGYVFRAHVHDVEARYESVVHVALVALPMVTLLTAAVWGVTHRGWSALGRAVPRRRRTVAVGSTLSLTA